MPNQNKNPSDKKYDLEERTARFGEEIIKFTTKIPRTPISMPLITQLVRSATSIGANYNEADGAESKKDFVHKISICKKEAKETKHWLRMIQTAVSDLEQECRKYWQEAQEFTLIFSTIINNSKNRD